MRTQPTPTTQEPSRTGKHALALLFLSNCLDAPECLVHQRSNDRASIGRGHSNHTGSSIRAVFLDELDDGAVSPDELGSSAR